MTRLLGSFGDAEGSAAAPIACVDIGTVLHEVLRQFVHATKSGTVQRREVAFVGRIYVYTGLTKVRLGP
jgi:hypothetical protein